ncbi:MAG: zinc ribbon domain-containing protein [Clostridia bacterium]|nr:zinc ribbon domain-containing protein [Clostridia bacterium]
MICKFCGAENPDGATVCGNCNNYLVEEYVEETPVMPKAAKILGIVSLVFSILAVPGTCLVFPGVISWLVALITSIIAKKKAKAVGLVSKPAKAAFIISIVELVVVVVGVLILAIAGGGLIATLLSKVGM